MGGKKGMSKRRKDGNGEERERGKDYDKIHHSYSFITSCGL